MLTFAEWMSGKKARKPDPPAAKNKDIDAFIQAVDNLKSDMDELDALEKKPKKPTPKVGKPKDDEKEELPEVPDEEDDDDTDDDSGVVAPDVDVRSGSKPLRLDPDGKVQPVPSRLRREPDSPTDS